MTLLQNTAEGGTSGTGCTTGSGGNTGGTSGDFLNVSSSARVSFDSAQKMHGSLSYKFSLTSGTSTTVDWASFTASQMAVRMYVRFNTVPAITGFRLMDVRDSAGAGVGRLLINASSQLVYQVNGVNKFTSTAISSGTWYRMEIVTSNGTTSTQKFDYYLGDSTTPVETGYSIGSIDSGTTNNITTFRVGAVASTTATDVLWIDDLAAQDGTLTYLGPVAVNGNVSAVAATATAAQVPAPAISADQVVSGGSADAVTATFNVPVLHVGATVTAVVATATSAQFVAPTFGVGNTVTAVVATATAAQLRAPVLNVGSLVTSVAATALEQMPSPTLGTGGNVNLNTVRGTSTALFLPPSVSTSSSPIVNAVVATATAAQFRAPVIELGYNVIDVSATATAVLRAPVGSGSASTVGVVVTAVATAIPPASIIGVFPQPYITVTGGGTAHFFGYVDEDGQIQTATILGWWDGTAIRSIRHL